MHMAPDATHVADYAGLALALSHLRSWSKFLCIIRDAPIEGGLEQPLTPLSAL